jgi:predicted nucleic acid-binding Zn ribbon protein
MKKISINILQIRDVATIFAITTTVQKGYFCVEECHRILEVGKKVKRVKRVMVDVISLAKNVALHVP